jgi:hypothetical protein
MASHAAAKLLGVDEIHDLGEHELFDVHLVSLACAVLMENRRKT